MTVSIRNLQGGASATPTTFSDAMNRASGPLGENWLSGTVFRTGAGAPVAQPSVSLAAAFDASGQCMKLASNNAPVVGSVQPLIVVPIQPLGLLNRSQFCQWTVVRHTNIGGAANNMFAGPTVLTTSPSGTAVDSNAYILQLESNIGIMVVIRRNGTVETGLIVGLTYTDNDVLRITAVINTSNVTLTVHKNGVLQATAVDAAAGRLTAGTPGWMGTSVNVANINFTSEWRNFSCGPA